jgi:hypothetical protein
MNRLLITALFLILCVTDVSAQVLWSANHDAGNMGEWYLNGCGGEFNSGVSQSVASTDVALSGSHSAKMTIGTPSAPESGARLFRWCESRSNQELYYSVWYFFPKHYIAPNWWNMFQWKSRNATRNDPFYILNVGNSGAGGAMRFYLYDWQRKRSHAQGVMDVPVGRWFQVEAFYRCAADGSGRVLFWQDGQLLFDVAGESTRYGDGNCEWSVTNYSDLVDPDPTTVYVDDAAIGLSRIGAGAPPPPPPEETQVPAAPSNLTGQALSRSEVRLNWRDNSSEETLFQIERSGRGTTLTSVPANSTQFANTGLKKNTTYAYRIRAVRGSAVSAWSNQVSVRTNH